MGDTELSRMYAARFGREHEAREDLWAVLVEGYFQRWIPQSATVLEVAAGHCEFINNVKAARKIAVDLNPDLVNYAAPDVETHVRSSTDLSSIADASVDIIFVSNFFEHISRPDILATIRESRRVLRAGGRLMVLQPNIRFCQRDYWMFFDHVTALDDRSLTEALALGGFDVEHCVVRFLPYTTKSRLPSTTALVRLYLRFPLAWRLLGQQTFVVARPITSSTSERIMQS